MSGASGTTEDPTLLWTLLNQTGSENGSALVRTYSPLETARQATVGLVLSVIALGAAFGNGLVVVSVYHNRKLRTVTNCFVVSLAVSDLLVGLLVLPLSIKVEVTGTWKLGALLCHLWTALDVMLCTASILNLCCISLDRYFAITDPLVYATKRSKRLALIMIALVWVASAAITCPPILGWQEEGRYDDDTFCYLSKEPGYIIYSALGSFYIPLLIMVFVYARIFQVTRKRAKHLRPFCRTFTFEKPRTRKKTSKGKALETPTMEMATPNHTLSGICTGFEKESSHGEEKTMGRSVLQDDIDTSIRSGKRVSVRHMREGLVLSSALAMTDISRAHRETRTNHADESTATSTSTCNARVTTSPRGARAARHNGGGACAKETDYLKNRDEKRRERAALQRESKTAKTLANVVGCFIVCWLPFFMVYVIDPFCEACDIGPELGSFVTWLGYCNSFINPFIYAFYNRDFRHTFWQLTCGLIAK